MFTTLKRILGSGMKIFWRNGFLSTSSIVTLTFALLTAASLFFASVLTQSLAGRVGDKIDVNIYFTPDTDIVRAGDFQKELFDKLDFIDKEKTVLISKDDALKEWKKIENSKTVNELLDILGENPLGPVLNIKAKDIDDYESIDDFIGNDKIQAKYGSILYSTNYDENIIIIKKIKI